MIAEHGLSPVASAAGDLCETDGFCNLCEYIGNCRKNTPSCSAACVSRWGTSASGATRNA